MLKRWFFEFTDFSNIWFAFFGHIFLKVPFMLFCVVHIITFTSFFVVNVYVCHVTKRVKDEAIRRVLESFDRKHENTREDRFLVEEALQRSLQWGDLGELAFGKYLGRYVIDCSLLIAVFFEAIAAICCVLDLVNIPVVYNSTKYETNVTSSTLLPIPHAVDTSDFSVYAVILVPIFAISILFLGYRTVGLFSFVGLVSIFLLIIMTFCPQKETDWTNGDQMIEGAITIKFMKMYGAPQVAIMMFAIHGSLKENRKHYSTALLSSFLLCFYNIIFMSIGCIFLGFRSQIFTVSFIKFWPLRALLMFAYVSFFFLLNFPLYDLLDRWLTKKEGAGLSVSILSTHSSDGRLTIDMFTTPSSRISIFQRIRAEDSRCELLAKDITDQMYLRVQSWKKYLVRVCVVAAEMVLAAIHNEFTISQMIHSYFEWIASVWIGIIMPISIFLKLMPRETANSTLNRVVCGLLILMSVGWILYLYTSVLWQSELVDVFLIPVSH